MVAAYWHEHEYKPGVFLPKIVTVGAPWDIPPDTVHILDLSEEIVQQALSKLTSHAKKKAAVALQSSLTPDELFQIQVETALATIRQMGPAAVFDQWMLITLFVCLSHAKFNPSKAGARRAAEDARRLLDALRPDLSARMTRLPEQLSDLKARTVDLHDRAVTLLKALRTFGLTNAILAKARDIFGGWVDRPDLKRWERMTPHAIALDILSGKSGLTRKALRDQLRLADNAKTIEEVWSGVKTYLLRQNEQVRERIAHFPSEPAKGGELAPQSP